MPFALLRAGKGGEEAPTDGAATKPKTKDAGSPIKPGMTAGEKQISEKQFLRYARDKRFAQDDRFGVLRRMTTLVFCS